MNNTSRLMGLFGGTFDPIHNGHLIPVEQAASELGITRVGLLPCHLPPHKAVPGVSASMRLDMVRLAVDQHPLFYVDDRELRSHSPSYTVNTLRDIKNECPDVHLCFFMGMDSLKQFNNWFQWQDILALAHLVVCQRGDEEMEFNDTVGALLSDIGTHSAEDLHQCESGRIFMAQTQAMTISATDIRQQIKSGKTADAPLHPDVKKYIAHHRLYRS